MTASRKGEAEKDRGIAQSQAVQLHLSWTGRRGGAWLTRTDRILSASREPPEISNKLAKAVSVKTRREPSAGLFCLARHSVVTSGRQRVIWLRGKSGEELVWTRLEIGSSLSLTSRSRLTKTSACCVPRQDLSSTQPDIEECRYLGLDFDVHD
ncbi:hypothetical protein CGCSCA4_v008639 [Colletotrichum siamense]|uniref:Uncharacterized protein n=1 Tax=Colletotrichum siamense TaxID=690259 RepID=A0A9P5EYG8_COLSI|nr:hypothetical protein CGCSCA4_v008639 [Colletotrichum siamense]KAF4862937.1 hypothetical protein CGCSCA2_v003086 [Colletotrichum siamense]